MRLIPFDGYIDDGLGNQVFVNPEDVSVVREWKYHSFRPAIPEIVMLSGERVRVWQDVHAVYERLGK
jgi:hypothetical protein